MNAQRRRLITNTSSNSNLNDPTNDDITYQVSETNVVNVHGLRFCFSIEPEVENANANGWWAVYCFPGETLTITNCPSDSGEFNGENLNAYLWGIGCWTASNQAPFHHEFAPSTSRTCQKGARIVAYVVKDGISAGAVRTIETLTFFTS